MRTATAYVSDDGATFMDRVSCGKHEAHAIIGEIVGKMPVAVKDKLIAALIDNAPAVIAALKETLPEEIYS